MDTPSNPTLPPILNRQLKQVVFTPRVMWTRERDMRRMRSNQRLEFLGDSVLHLCSTLLLEELYPDLSSHHASRIRNFIVSNRFFATVSQGYGLLRQVKHLSRRDWDILNGQMKAHADIFEAYIGAMHTEHGFEVVRNFVFELMAPFARAKHDQLQRGEHLGDFRKKSRSQHLRLTPVQTLASFSSAIVEPPSSPHLSDMSTINWETDSNATDTISQKASVLTESRATPPPDYDDVHGLQHYFRSRNQTAVLNINQVYDEPVWWRVDVLVDGALTTTVYRNQRDEAERAAAGIAMGRIPNYELAPAFLIELTESSNGHNVRQRKTIRWRAKQNADLPNARFRAGSSASGLSGPEKTRSSGPSLRSNDNPVVPNASFTSSDMLISDTSGSDGEA